MNPLRLAVQEAGGGDLRVMWWPGLKTPAILAEKKNLTNNQCPSGVRQGRKMRTARQCPFQKNFMGKVAKTTTGWVVKASERRRTPLLFGFLPASILPKKIRALRWKSVLIPGRRKLCCWKRKKNLMEVSHHDSLACKSGACNTRWWSLLPSYRGWEGSIDRRFGWQ